MAEDSDMGMTPPEESGNRTFLIAAIILGVIFVIALISIFALYFLTQPPAQPPPQNLTATMAVQLKATQTAAFLATQTKQAQAQQTAAISRTPTITLTATRTRTRTVTPVVFATILLATDTSTATAGGAVATATLSTGTGTASPPARTATPTSAATKLPQTGYGESSGLLGLLTLAGASMMIIVLARNLRLARAKRRI
jgi:flagellar basal body-associated protein FliL